MSADPQSLGPYRIVRRVGAGGMGVVFEAVHTGLEKRVALKVLPRELVANRLERFLREARTAAALHHTNIVPVFDVGQVDGVPYFAMQYIDGRPLGSPPETGTRAAEPDGTKSFAPTPDSTTDHAPADPATRPDSPHVRHDPRAVVAQVLQAAEGLAYAHERGVVHRDIKPGNLLLDADGVVWVADFGLAFRAADPTMTADGAVIGTPRYMSPEQARGEKTDVRTDVFSLGVTLYELLTCKAAFPGNTVVEVLHKVISHTPPTPRSLDRRISADLDTVVQKAMAKRREDRYATGREFADDLKRAVNGEAVKARRIGPIGTAWRWSKRNPAVASLLAAVLLVFAVGAGGSAYYANQAELREADARKNLGESVANFAQFERQADLTIQALNLAQKREHELVATGKRNRRLLYAARIGLAGAAFKERNYDRVSELLTETMPAAGDDDPRGWEWHYLFRQVHSERQVIQFHPERTVPVYAGPDRYVECNDRVDWRVHDYDATTGKLLRDRPGPPWANVSTIHASADGRQLFGATTGELWVWDIETAKETARLKVALNPHAVGRFILSDDTADRQFVLSGDTFASVVPVGTEGPRDPARCQALNLATKKTTPLPAPPGYGTLDTRRHLALTADARRLGSMDEANRLVVWDVATGAILLDRPSEGATRFTSEIAFAFSPDGTRVVARSAEGSGVEVFDLTGPRARLTFAALRLSEHVDHVAFSPDGRRVLAALPEGEFHVLDPSGLAAPQRFRFTSGHSPRHVFFRADGKRVCAYDPNGIREWVLTEPSVARPGGVVPKDNANYIGEFSPDGSKVALAGEWAAASQVDEVRIWNLTGRDQSVCPTALFGQSITRRSLSWSADGRWVAVAVWDEPAALRVPALFSEWDRFARDLARLKVQRHGERILLIDAITGRIARVRLWPEGFTTDIRASPCGQWLVCEGDTRFVILNAATLQATWDDPGAADCDTYTQFAPDSKLIVCRDAGKSGGEAEVFVCDPKTNRRTRFDSPGAACLGLPAASDDGRWVAAKAGASQFELSTLRVWDARTGKSAAAVPLGSNIGPYDRIRFSPCGRWVATQTQDRRIELIDTETWTRRRTLTTPNSSQVAHFTSDGRRLLGFYATEARQELKVWDTESGQELLTVPCHAGPGLVDALRPHFDGAKLTFARAAGAERLLELETLDGTPVPDALARERLGIK